MTQNIESLRQEYGSWLDPKTRQEIKEMEERAYRTIEAYFSRNDARDRFWYWLQCEPRDLIKYLVGVQNQSPEKAFRTFGYEGE